MKDILNKREGEREKKKKTIKRWNYSSPLKHELKKKVCYRCYCSRSMLHKNLIMIEI